MNSSTTNTPQRARSSTARHFALLLTFGLAVLLPAACGPNDEPPKTPIGSVEVVTADAQLAMAKLTIEAAIEGGAPWTPTPHAPTPAATSTPVSSATPIPSDTPAPTATPVASDTPFPTATATPSATVTPSATPSPTPMPTLDSGATTTALAKQLAAAVAASLTAAATPTSTPDVQATLESQLATAVAGTLAAQPRPTNTPVPPPTSTRMPPPTSTLPPPPPTATLPPPPPRPPSSGAAQELQARLGSASIGSRFPNESYAFAGAIGSHIGDFQLPNLGITTATMNDALRRNDAPMRANALVNQVWGDWLRDVGGSNSQAYSTDPGAAGLSPFRQLVVRLIQGRQGTLVDNQQHGLYNFFTRKEEDRAWYDNVNGVIGAVNRESFLWP